MADRARLGWKTTGTAPFPAKMVLAVLAVLWLSLVLFNAGEDVLGVTGQGRIGILDVDAEASLYTWLSQLLLAGSGVLLLIIGWEQVDDPPWIRWQWFALGGLFFFLSADEAVAIHERLVEPVRRALHTHGALAWAWVIPYGAACLIGLLAAIPFLRRLPKATLASFLAAAAIYLTGALGLEMVGSYMNDSHGTALSRDAPRGETLYRSEATVEEGLEGLGLLVFLAGLMSYRARHAGGLVGATRWVRARLKPAGDATVTMS